MTVQYPIPEILRQYDVKIYRDNSGNLRLKTGRENAGTRISKLQAKILCEDLVRGLEAIATSLNQERIGCDPASVYKAIKDALANVRKYQKITPQSPAIP